VEKIMEKMLSDLKKIVRFKDTTDSGDIVLLVAEKPQMLIYALVTSVVRDETKKEEWWHVTMQVLTVPPHTVTWTLRTPQMTGLEIFTMNGEKRFVKAVQFSRDRPVGVGTKTGGRKKPHLIRMK
jgi:hypothetical protein